MQSLAGHRREALWEAAGAVPDKDLLRPNGRGRDPDAGRATEGEEIVGDYRAQGLTLGPPSAALSESLLAQRFMPASVMDLYPTANWRAAAGLVTVRQRPGTAKGVLFLSLEAETGNVNVIVSP